MTSEIEASIRLRLLGQAALLGLVTPNFRSVSGDLNGKTVIVSVVFAEQPTEAEQELFSLACTYIIADYSDEILDERISVSLAPLCELTLPVRMYERYETDLPLP